MDAILHIKSLYYTIYYLLKQGFGPWINKKDTESGLGVFGVF